MRTPTLNIAIGFALGCALSPAHAVAQDDGKQTRTENVICEGDEEITLRDVELRGDQPISVSDSCELELVNVVVRGEGAVLVVNDDGEVTLDNADIQGDVSLGGSAEIDVHRSTLRGNLTLADSAEAELRDSVVEGDISVADEAELDDEGGNELRGRRH